MAASGSDGHCATTHSNETEIKFHQLCQIGPTARLPSRRCREYGLRGRESFTP